MAIVTVKRKELLLYKAFLLTTLGDRMWMFAIGLFMEKLGGMAFVAIQQLVDALLKLTCISLIGPYLDKVDRRTIIQRSLIVNNLAVAASALIFAYMFAFQGHSPPMFLLMFAVLIASASRVASEIQRVCFTKDWVVVISEAETLDLGNINKRTLAVDQISSIIFPVITGLLLDYIQWEYVCLFIVVYNLVSWAIESSILNTLYNETDELKSRKCLIANDEDLRGLRDITGKSCSVYGSQSSFLAGFGLTLLFMTVLGFDNLAASYGLRHGMSTTAIGVFRCFGSVMGVMGVFAFDKSQRWFGLLWTVMIGLLWQNVFISLSGASVLMPGSSMDVSGFIQNTTTKEWITEVGDRFVHPKTNEVESLPFSQVPTPIILFFVGISMARFGLWIADPAINQIQQETVPESQRYTVFLTQSALCELFSFLKDIIVILLPFTSMFGALTLGSCVFVFSGFLLNIIYHLKCGVSCSNKKMHLRGKTENNVELPERESLMEQKIIPGALPEKEPIIEKNGKLDD